MGLGLGLGTSRPSVLGASAGAGAGSSLKNASRRSAGTLASEVAENSALAWEI